MESIKQKLFNKMLQKFLGGETVFAGRAVFDRQLVITTVFLCSDVRPLCAWHFVVVIS